MLTCFRGFLLMWRKKWFIMKLMKKRMETFLWIQKQKRTIRQIFLNIPILFTLNFLFGMTGIIWTQASADFVNVIISYIIYYRVMKNLE